MYMYITFKYVTHIHSDPLPYTMVLLGIWQSVHDYYGSLLTLASFNHLLTSRCCLTSTNLLLSKRLVSEHF
jgi:hypothetical protein